MADFPEECLAQKEDYLECLHHTKERQRAKLIKQEEIRQRKKAEEAARKHADSAAKSKVFRLGIIEKPSGESESENSSR
ncbi:3531_t:CDS:2 [Ambispora gerdemannii]|uniref:3531_t:CDS:1 n=1 Tax=Ambispora gerdemannii TaxID=144530 RepID=A0A9N9CKE1_9GLOM|nr:3531_t:CDS:2 [Ambispora gerdemannii]